MRKALAFLALASALASPGRASAQSIDIKLGTLAPKGSTWETLMKEMGQKWKEASGGRVNLKIFAGGVLGNEGDMVRKMRVGQLQASALTTVGLHEITPEPLAITAPMVIQSYDELDYVMDKMAPSLEKQLADKGYVVLAWSEVGFVYFFSTQKFQTVEQAKKAKVFTWEGDPASAEAWKATGLNAVVLSATDIVPSLQTGMIDTVATSPLYALTARFYDKANKMLDLPWALVTGATIVKKETWDKVPADLQPTLLTIAREYGRRLTLDVRKMNQDALAQLKGKGVEVVPVQDMSGWKSAADRANGVVRGKVVPAPVFDEVVKYHKEFGARGGKK